MLSWDGFEKAWNVLEWNFSFSIGDGVTLVVATLTAILAFFTYRIQGAQKKVVEQQNKIIERQVLIEEEKYRREKHLLKNKLKEAILSFAKAVMEDRDPEEEEVEFLHKNNDFIEDFFSREVFLFVINLHSYRMGIFTYGGLLSGEQLSKDEMRDVIEKDYTKILLLTLSS
ncbi:hypothetical protein [Maridesulfovibrio ferrireducens]|uniref:hypothetical protein n=1 Tax=Maridesulfovibrio ferrireducens TaxID=246191 RepID=UPI001A2109E3|nr:hypothetical protein [Maridesulfovibrio ferrireducens]MBI9112430.1 hypothetical protein [Maridesulfovibrio ferrireducens]